ncbi:hypothetical protein AG1IA_01452 [Rhizoctonia solani AG-1 IA]|uniref:Uncharacterized protein n=1 Tax=Thanatephorus cucumeris (strain AG1-IA) TaxID=983506 RepID=L8X653_THACA|nr:hypothetical protein AG1IA_01452 [Rhizoctonia solani AG-1 IA]
MPASAMTLPKSVWRNQTRLCPPQFCTFALCPVGCLVRVLRTLCPVDTIPCCRRVWRMSSRHSPYVNMRATIRTVLPIQYPRTSVRTQRRSWSFICRRSFSFPPHSVLVVLLNIRLCAIDVL